MNGLNSTQARHTSRYGICFPGACIVTIMSLDVVCECFLVQLGDEVRTCPHFFPFISDGCFVYPRLLALVTCSALHVKQLSA